MDKYRIGVKCLKKKKFHAEFLILFLFFFLCMCDGMFFSVCSDWSVIKEERCRIDSGLIDLQSETNPKELEKRQEKEMKKS